jgi:tetratricopeptide (TPR) repeat protein
MAALVILVTVAGVYLVRRRSSQASSLTSVTLPQNPGKRSVAVMYFDNQSNSSDLDWLREGLADMLITDLSRSKNLAVLSRQQLQLLLERSGRSEHSDIQLDEALDIAHKSQAQVVILGSFARLGEQIRVDVRLHDARDGQLLTAERMVVEQPAQILTQIDLLCLELASHLSGGASEPASNTALVSVMTNNLEAYRDYSLGVEKSQAKHSEEAIAFLQKAVALDPEFAMAYARIGYTYVISLGRVAEGKPYLEKAFQLSARLTEEDKLNIAAWYSIANLDYAAAIKSFQEIVARYPLEVEAYQRLGNLLRGEERAEEAIEVIKQGLIMDSGAKELYNELGGVYMELGRHDEAIAMFQHYVDLAPQEANAYDSLGSGYQWAGRYQEAVAAYSRALILKPNFEIAVIHLGNTFYQLGRCREAIQQYQRYINVAPSDDERARGHNSISNVLRLSGKLDEAEREAKAATKYVDSSVSQLLELALLKGDLRAAATFMEVLEGDYFRGYQITNRGAKRSQREASFYQARFELKSSRTSEAIANFKEALKHRPLIYHFDPFEDCLANAYLELGRWDEAIVEYERILRLNPNYPLVQYHLAQAYERKGKPDQARDSYERFLKVWKDADPDVPEIVAARRMVGASARQASETSR